LSKLQFLFTCLVIYKIMVTVLFILYFNYLMCCPYFALSLCLLVNSNFYFLESDDENASRFSSSASNSQQNGSRLNHNKKEKRVRRPRSTLRSFLGRFAHRGNSLQDLRPSPRFVLKFTKHFIFKLKFAFTNFFSQYKRTS